MSDEDLRAGQVADVRGEVVEATATKSVAKTMLSGHIPLSLLMDMSSQAGPDSQGIFVSEGNVDEEWWVPAPSPRNV